MPAPDPTLAARLATLAAAHGDRAALIHTDCVTTFRELAADAGRRAAALARAGVQRGTRVGLLMPNRPEWLGCAFAAWQLGAVIVPLNTLWREPELGAALAEAEVEVVAACARFLTHDYETMFAHLTGSQQAGTPLPALSRVLLDPAQAPALDWMSLRGANAGSEAPPGNVRPDDDAVIFFTSGSTAAPKGVVHTHASLLAAADAIGERLGLTPEDRTWAYLPFFFAGGLVAVALATLGRGGAILLQEVFEPEAALAMMERHRCTTFFAWPHQVEALVRHPRFDRHKLAVRKGVGANAKWAAEWYPPDHHAVGTWGMTETASIACAARFDDPLPLRSSAHGRPIAGLELRIVDPDTGEPLSAGSDGEICVRGRSVMRTYYKRPPTDCFDPDGFFHTGDLGRLDAGGSLHFVGRLKDIIKTAGVNVAAADVEATLMAHPAVEVAHVVPVPHPTRGENVAAFVVLRDATCTPDDLLAHCRARLASYKVPRHLFLCQADELPVLGSGKVDRAELRALARARVGASAAP